MFSRRRSSAFLMDIVDGGVDFVETLKIFYPKASELNEKDLDWLFDYPDLEHFLEWFCNVVGEDNVLKPTEVEAYENLINSGKPILDEEALNQVLKTCHQFSQLRDTVQEKETLSNEILEKEVQMLKQQCACRRKRRNKLEIHISSMRQKSSYLEEKLEKASRQLNKAYLQLEVDNFQSNDVFSQASKLAKGLVQWHGETGNDNMKPLVAMMNLKYYLKLEEQFTDDLLRFLPKALKSIINDMEPESEILAKKEWEGSQKELSAENIAKPAQKVPLENKGVTYSDNYNRTAGVLRGHSIYWECMIIKEELELAHTIVPKEIEQSPTEKLWTEALDFQCFSAFASQRKQASPIQVGNHKDGNLGNYQEELGHMELSYLSSQRLLVMTSAEIEGMSSALQWARKALNAAKEKKIKEEEEDELRFHIAACQEQRSILQNEVDQVISQLLMPLVQGNARLLRLPVICGELELEAIRLGRVELLQEEAVVQLMGQLSQLDVLKLLLLLEEKNLHRMNTPMLAIVNESEATLQKLQFYLEASTFSVMQCSQKLIDPSDSTTLRMWKMLDPQGQEKQLFRTYEMLEDWGSRLCQEVKMLKVQLVTPLSQLSKLESYRKILYSMMYGDSNLLMLHGQDLSESLEQLSTMQTTLFQMLMAIQSDLKVKHQRAECHVQQAVRNLYIHFFNNPTQLKKLVEELEENANRVCF